MPSTVIRNTNYDPATRILSVWFVPSGIRYDYEDVAPATYAAFRKASSKGRFFNEFIRDHHKYRRFGERRAVGK
ncbi:KTSC domain-containing protein [Mesorhizobium sp. M0496]|uniref:KTSC domain-containing protein n=1 Tax=Mesorhizobium sp. M0496 TaxID=2956952 RepID=UPI003335194E